MDWRFPFWIWSACTLTSPQAVPLFNSMQQVFNCSVDKSQLKQIYTKVDVRVGISRVNGNRFFFLLLGINESPNC
jgi:hypothetical protein